MDDELASSALRALGRRVRGAPVALAGSMSRSGVYRVDVDGMAAVLKVTAAGPEFELARRELTFYRTLADLVPVRTPRLLEYVETDGLTALLLSAHTPGPPASKWDRSGWLRVAGELAALHSFPAPAGALWERRPWIRSVLAEPPLRTVEEFWSSTAAGATGLVGPLLDDPAALLDALDAVPNCFVHGDCHVGNLLLDGSDLVWTDWQVTGIGSPAGDLAFLWGRAYSDSADPPYDEMLHEYATSRGVDPAPMRRSMIAAELSTMLFGWPHFAHLHPRAERDRVVERFVQLGREWLT